VILGDPIEEWPAGKFVAAPARLRLARQSVAIGPASDAKLAGSTVAILGLSGGGSHVNQQLAHLGVGSLIAVDDDLVEETNRGRLIGATAADDGLPKVGVAKRIAHSIDPDIEFTGVAERFPSPKTVAALKEADLIIACLDRFDARAALNSFARRHLIPLLDIGITIRSKGERLLSADGQLIVSLPGRPCLRCSFLTDAVLAAERRDRPASYDRNPDALGEPQVVSMNGLLASQAVSTALELITGYSRVATELGHWQYDARRGELTAHKLAPRRPGCPGCTEEALGDPLVAIDSETTDLPHPVVSISTLPRWRRVFSGENADAA
jgi:molybdopterin/thiamine biosynthesis adenylyltransferase